MVELCRAKERSRQHAHMYIERLSKSWQAKQHARCRILISSAQSLQMQLVGTPLVGITISKLSVTKQKRIRKQHVCPTYSDPRSWCLIMTRSCATDVTNLVIIIMTAHSHVLIGASQNQRQ